MKLFFISVGIFLLVISLWIGSFFAVNTYISTTTERGTFGDQFGAVNALFSGLAFAGLIITILLQREELKAQREELQYTRQEIKGQKLELKQQNETLALQRFEHSFFSLLSQYNDLISRFKYSLGGGAGYSGREVFAPIISIFINGWHNNRLPCATKEEKIYKAGVLFEDMNGRFPEIISLYFRGLDVLFITLKQSSAPSRYAEIIKSQMTNDELLLMLIFCLYEADNFLKVHVEEYSLFKSLDVRKLVSIGLDKDCYAEFL